MSLILATSVVTTGIPSAFTHLIEADAIAVLDHFVQHMAINCEIFLTEFVADRPTMSSSIRTAPAS